MTSQEIPTSSPTAGGPAVGDFTAALLRELGVVEMIGVPDSQLHDALASLPSEIAVTYTVREDTAVAIAAGKRLARCRAGVFMKNAGIGTSMDAIVSLLIGCEISMPALLVVPQ